MKLAISGSAGTGKSTLAKNIADQTGWAYIPEFAKEACDKMRVKTPRDILLDKVLEFQTLILDMKLEAESKQTNFVADRSSADNLGYYLWRNSRIDYCDNNYIKRCADHATTYDHTIFLDWGAFPIVDDGFRSTNKYYQLSIHYLIKGILTDLNIKHTCFDIKTKQQREYTAMGLVTAFHSSGNDAVKMSL